jgi:hypothetical protein
MVWISTKSLISAFNLVYIQGFINSIYNFTQKVESGLLAICLENDLSWRKFEINFFMLIKK